MTQSNKRWQSVDVFRGLTMALMIIVNSLGGPVNYSELLHSAWNGCTFADIVFPFFLMLLGLSTVLALTRQGAKKIALAQCLFSIIKRSVTLFLWGLTLNAFLHFSLEHLRFFGVLQRIALCYLLSAVLFLSVSRRTQGLIILLILLVYQLMLQNGEPLSISHNPVGSIDTWLFPTHLYSAIFDPEGLLSTLPAIASTLLGSLLGYQLVSMTSLTKTGWWIVKMGFALALVGWLVALWSPFNKALWSSSYVLWTSGLAYLLYALCFFLIEAKSLQKWARPWRLFGQHALSVYILHIVGLKLQLSIFISGVNLKTYCYQLIAQYFSPAMASLLYALAYMLFWLLLLEIVVRGKKLIPWKKAIFRTSLLPVTK